MRRNGHALETETIIKDAPIDDQSIERYIINDKMIEMIRASPHNPHLIMASRQEEVLGPAQPDAGVHDQPQPEQEQVPTNGGPVASI